jgi:hypothetical protein
MHEPLPLAVGKKCLQSWNEIGPLDIKRLVDNGICTIDQNLTIEQ